MDDCFLNKLSIKPGQLDPAFNRNVYEYSTTVGSKCKSLDIFAETSDRGACISISGSGGTRTVPLEEGSVTSTKLEVTAEDGTTKIYIINITRLSADLAQLESLILEKNPIQPHFSPDIHSYDCLVPCDQEHISINPHAFDDLAIVKINGMEKTDVLKLNYSDTKVVIEVTSPSKKKTQKYNVTITRKQIPFYIRISSPDLVTVYEDPVSLSPIYQPVTIKNSKPKHSFSAAIIDELTKTYKRDPLNDAALGKDWRVEDLGLDNLIGNTEACIPLMSGDMTEEDSIHNQAARLRQLIVTPKLQDPPEKYPAFVKFEHVLKVHPWEKTLQESVQHEDNFALLIKSCNTALNEYCNSLPKPGFSAKYTNGTSPLVHLQKAAGLLALAIKVKPRDATAHLKLAHVLEESYYAEDMLGLKDKEKVELPSMDFDAKESSKAEECAAICQLRGVTERSPIALQLKAIDQEYQHLLQNGNRAKADHVMDLFVWKSKQASQEGRAAQKVQDEQSTLGRAYIKYLDALSLEQNKSVYPFNVGRMLVIQGNYDKAIKYLETAISWQSTNVSARFYLGYALSLCTNGPGDRKEEAIQLLKDGIEALLYKNSMNAFNTEVDRGRHAILLSEDLIRTSNVHMLRGMIQLGKLLVDAKIHGCMSTSHMFHTAAFNAATILPRLVRGDLYTQVEWVLLEAHSHLLDSMMTESSGNKKLVNQRCERLSALIHRSTIPQCAELQAIKKRTFERLVWINPCSSYALNLLGHMQLAMYDDDPENNAEFLSDCKKSFLASIDLEGKSTNGDPPPGLTEQQWWMETEIEENKKLAKRPNIARRGSSFTKAAGSKSVEASSVKSTLKKSPNTALKVAEPSPRRPSTTKPIKPSTSTGNTALLLPPKSTPEDETINTRQPSSSEEIINPKSYGPRLGMARVLSKNPETCEEAHKYYLQVIEMAPDLHEAYIESAEMIVSIDPFKAVNIYYKFPKNPEPTFDDAYIYGEINRLLIRIEYFDDPRLVECMIAQGKIMGLGSLEKYTKVLEDKGKFDQLMKIFAGVNGRTVDDPEMKHFFQMKMWK